MHIQFILLVVIVAVAVQAKDKVDLKNSKYVTDAAEWVKLRKSYYEAGPKVMTEERTTKCQIIKECCPDKIDQLFSIIHKGEFEEMCYGLLDSDLFKSKSSKCHDLVQRSFDIINDADYKKAVEVTNIEIINNRFNTRRSEMIVACKADELKSFYCEPINSADFQPCAEKVLRLAGHASAENTYKTYVDLLKSDYTKTIDLLSKAFPTKH